jgi:hypothetical protein
MLSLTIRVRPSKGCITSSVLQLSGATDQLPTLPTEKKLDKAGVGMLWLMLTISNPTWSLFIPVAAEALTHCY